MDPFTQRMLERARARQEKIDQKLASSGQTVPKRKPLSENIMKADSPSKSPAKSIKSSVTSPKSSITSPPAKNTRSSISSPRKGHNDTVNAITPAKTLNRRSSTQKSDQLIVASPQRPRNDVIVTRKEFKTTKRGSMGRRNSDVSVEINISHRNDIQIEVQVEENDAPISVVYDSQKGGNVVIKEIEEGSSDQGDSSKMAQTDNNKSERNPRNHFKSRLDRLGNLYSDNPQLSSPIHRTEQAFHSETPPAPEPGAPPAAGRKFGRLAALADQINNWEDDLSHHSFNPEPAKKPATKAFTSKPAKDKLESSTLDVSIHSLNDINKVLHTTKSKQTTTSNSQTFKKPMNECQRLQKDIVAELEGAGYRRVSASQSRLVYDFAAPNRADPARQETSAASPSAAAAPSMATMVATGPAAPVTKKPSLKKYKAPTPPNNNALTDDECESEKDKENNVLPSPEGDNDAADCKQTKPEPADGLAKPILDKGSPVIKRIAPKLNGNADRTSVLSKAAMFESGSPKAKDPAEMSLRERKALFEKNKGAAIVPKAPFGQAPSVKTLYGDNKDKPKPATPRTPTQQRTPTVSTSSSSRSTSREEVDDNVSQSSLGGGIKGKLQALFSKEQTISESTIANKFKQEREKEMEMLQNRFHYKPPQKEANNDSDDDQSDTEPSDQAPLMRSSTSLNAKKPEIVANVPKVTFEKTKSETALHNDEIKVVGSQPAKRRSSQDSPVVLSVVEDVKRIKVNNKTNGAVLNQPRLYPHLSDIETDNTNSHEEYSDCGGSRCGHYTLDVENIPDNVHQDLNKSENWAETSFGREVMNVVKKNNTSYKKAVRESDSDSSAAGDSELDEMLDEALAEESEGPTPPKVNKNVATPTIVYQEQMVKRSIFVYQDRMRSQTGAPVKRELFSNLAGNSDSFQRTRLLSSFVPLSSSTFCKWPPISQPSTSCGNQLTYPNGLSSSSFVYQAESQQSAKQQAIFKSPLKAQPSTPASHRDKGSELVHSVSFYRRMQSASSTPTTPLRQVRHHSPERAPPAADEPSVTTVRQRIKELQNEISKQQTVISQASQALNLCAATIEFSGSTEQAEGERLLLLATHRRSACVHEMQRLQVEGAGCAAAAGAAELRLHGLSAPLRRDYVRQLNADGAVGHHAVCLIKCRDRVLATSMQLTRPSSALLHFPDEIQMLGLTSDFKVTVEIYLLQASKEMLPHDVKYHITSKKSSKLLTPKGKSALKTPTVQSPAGPLAVRSPQFQLYGYCIFALPQASRKSFTLMKVPAASPLEGTINMDIRARVRLSAPEPHCAFLTAFDDVSGLGAWHRRWFRLQPPRLAYWKYPDDVQKKMPIGDIDLSTVISEKAIKAPRDLCARPHTILLETAVPAGLVVPDGGSLVYVRRGAGVARRHLLAADTAADRDLWLERLNAALEYARCCSTDED